MDKNPRCDECAYAIGNDIGAGYYICRRYPTTVPKVPEMWCGEWRDKEHGAEIREIPSVWIGTGSTSVPITTTGDTDYHWSAQNPDTTNYGKHAISGDSPPQKKKRGRPRKSGS